MAAAENRSQMASLPSPNRLNRKCCSVCVRFVYLHQPVLMCAQCNDIFHGKCLKFTNFVVFNLQQTGWCCSKYSNENNQIVCRACSSVISVESEKFEICKNCLLPTHKICSFSKLCLHCIPEIKPVSAAIKICQNNVNHAVHSF